MIFRLSRLFIVRAVLALKETAFLISAIGLVGAVVYGNFIVSRPWCFAAHDKAEFSQMAYPKTSE
jgi:hypothetical protein